MKNEKYELYDDVLEEYEKEMQSTKNSEEIDKVERKYDKRLTEAIGRIDYMQKGEVYCREDKNGIMIPDSSVENVVLTWEINVGGSQYSTTNEDHAITFAYIVEMDARIKRMEETLKRIEKALGAKNV